MPQRHTTVRYSGSRAQGSVGPITKFTMQGFMRGEYGKLRFLTAGHTVVESAGVRSIATVDPSSQK
jgi:hypothetical protein